MAIHITEVTGEDGQPETVIRLNNGDREAFNSVMRRWRFRDGIGMLRFMFSILSKGHQNKVYVLDETGKQTAFEPVASLLVPNTDAENGAGNDGTNAQPQHPVA